MSSSLTLIFQNVLKRQLTAKITKFIPAKVRQKSRGHSVQKELEVMFSATGKNIHSVIRRTRRKHARPQAVCKC